MFPKKEMRIARASAAVSNETRRGVHNHPPYRGHKLGDDNLFLCN